MATATMGQSSVDRLARSKRPTVERAEIHIPPAPVFPLEAVTGDPRMRAQAVAAFNNALQKWRNDAWSIEAPFVPDAELQADVATLEDTTAKMSTKLDRAAIDIRLTSEAVTTIDNRITTINNQITIIDANAITGTGIVQANGSNPPTAILGTPGHVPYWTSVGPPYISPTSPIYTDGTLVGIGTDLPAVLLDVGLAGVTSGVMRLAGVTSGNVIIQTAAAAGTWTFTLPVNDGSSNEFLKTNGSGVTSWSSVVLTTDVVGVLPVANGGTNASSWTAGSVIFAGAGGTSLAQDNANFFWDDTTNRLGIGTAAPGASLEIVSTTPIRLARSGLNAFTVAISGLITGTLGGDLVWNTAQTDGGFAWRINNGSVVALAIAEGGNIGIRNTNPGAMLDLGLAGTTLGVMRMAGSTSGNVTIQPAVVAGAWTLTLPAIAGGVGSIFTSNGSGVASWTTVLPIANGGTNASSFTSGRVIFFDGTRLADDGGLTYVSATNSLNIGEANSAQDAILQILQNTAPRAFFADVGDIGSADAEWLRIDKTPTGGHLIVDAQGTGTVRSLSLGTGVGFGVRISTSNFVRIGSNVDALAVLHLIAGTAAANTAPLKFTAGTILATPESGVIEYNNRFFLTDTDSVQRHIVQAVSATKTTAGAPYANDGYVDMVINGTTVRVMTTA